MKEEGLDTQNALRMADELSWLVRKLHSMGRDDLLLHAISVPVLERLRIEAARAKLSRLVITEDFRFLLADYNKEVILNPVHKALYLLFLNHPEGIEFKSLVDHSRELLSIYKAIAPRMEKEKIEETVARLTDPRDNAINEKCSRIKSAFAALMDEYTLSYYSISSHAERHFNSSSRVWFTRLKVITLPRELVIKEFFIKDDLAAG